MEQLHRLVENAADIVADKGRDIEYRKGYADAVSAMLNAVILGLEYEKRHWKNYNDLGPHDDGQ